LIPAISQAASEGLRPEDYYLTKIEAILEELKENRKKGEIMKFRHPLM